MDAYNQGCNGYHAPYACKDFTASPVFTVSPEIITDLITDRNSSLALIRTKNKVTGIVEYRKLDGRLHCEDGPARCKRGRREYWVNGLLHRENGPAYIEYKRTKGWLFPLRIVEYWLEGERLSSREELKQRLTKRNGNIAS